MQTQSTFVALVGFPLEINSRARKFTGKNYGSFLALALLLNLLTINYSTANNTPRPNQVVLPAGASKTFSFSTCPTITNTTLTSVTVCSGQKVSLLEVNTTALSDYTIEFLKFDDKQTNPYTNMVGTFVGEVTATDGKATLTNVDFPVNTSTTDRVYYVYACLKPVPVDTTCIPFAYITVTIKANPAATLVAKEATCNGSDSQNDGSVAISGYEPTATYELSTNGIFAGIGQPIPAGGVLLSGLSRTGSQQTYIVRIYNSIGCTTEKVVTLLNASCLCPPPRCVPIAIQKIKSGRMTQ